MSEATAMPYSQFPILVTWLVIEVRFKQESQANLSISLFNAQGAELYLERFARQMYYNTVYLSIYFTYDLWKKGFMFFI